MIMLSQKQKKKENIVEFILYLWHLEDIVRSFNFDLELILEKLVLPYTEDEKVIKENQEWYATFIGGMEEMEVTEKGHSKEAEEALKELSYLHQALLNVFQDKNYMGLYDKAFPNIQELGKRADREITDEVELCLTGLYGVMTLKLHKKGISEETRTAAATFSEMLAYLAKKYRMMMHGELQFPNAMNN